MSSSWFQSSSSRRLSQPHDVAGSNRTSTTSNITPVTTHSHESSHGSQSSPAAQDHSLSAKERLDEYNQTKGRTLASVHSEVTDPEEATLVQCLAMQAYHLPGNNWRQDWWQYMLNNHPVFGVFFHHPKHPIKCCTRFIAMIGTIVVGLAITNAFYLFYVLNPQFNKTLVTVVVDDKPKTTLTTGMLLLWTLGGAIHTFYNLLQWHIAACACCRPGGWCERQACCPSLGKHLLRAMTLVVISMTILIVLLRVAIANSREDDSEPTATSAPGVHFLDDDSLQLEVHGASEFEFLIGYLVEMALALLVYYPIGGTILFSGILGCGKIPFLGGRPLEVAQEERRLAKKQRPAKSFTVDVEASVPVEHVRGNPFD